MPLIANPLRLRTLSPEILSKIAVFSAGPSLLYLGRTCHAVRSICYDSVIFKNAVRFKLREEHASDENATDALLSTLAKRANDDVDVWARYLIALSDVEHLAGMSRTRAGNESVVVASRRMMAFMPQLLALGCKSASNTGMATHLALIRDATNVVQDETTLSKLSFCFASETSEPVNLLSSNDDQCQELQGAFWNFRMALMNDLIVDPHEVFREGNHQIYLLIAVLMQALQRQGVPIPALSSVIRSSIQKDASELPLPYRSTGDTTGDDWVAWLKKRTSVMATKERLEEGEWCGYTTNDPHFIGFSGLLSGMRFEVQEEGTDYAIRSQGGEGDQRFTLEGTISRIDGGISLKLGYDQLPHQSQWHGYMTIYGMVGYWNMAYSPQPMGLFWIWKRVWMNV